ncbi:Hypothetical protein A7982_04597 [Minicystis rosea]|nr:Hypothetical protein A7982_04597 [Minicystis rosea]
MAFFHVLRQPALDDDDQAFLIEHADVLTIPDLLAWRSCCATGFTGAVIRRLAQIALEDPVRFDHELLRAPRLHLVEEEWIEMTDLVRGKVSDALYERLLARGRRHALRDPEPPAPADPIDLSALLAGALDDPGFPLDSKALPISADEAPEAILERARQAFSAEERAALLGWLSQRGFARRPLVEVALGAVRSGALDPALLGWLADQLATRSAWEAHGVDVFLSFIDPGLFAELEDLLAQIWSHASRAPIVAGHDAPEGPSRLLIAMHATFAAALVQAAREGLGAGDPAKALTALSALACLDPPPRLGRTIHDLSRMDGTTAEVRSLIELNIRLVKHAGAREASFGGVIAAVQGLADARLT